MPCIFAPNTKRTGVAYSIATYPSAMLQNLGTYYRLRFRYQYAMLRSCFRCKQYSTSTSVYVGKEGLGLDRLGWEESHHILGGHVAGWLIITSFNEPFPYTMVAAQRRSKAPYLAAKRSLLLQQCIMINPFAILFSLFERVFDIS